MLKSKMKYEEKAYEEFGFERAFYTKKCECGKDMRVRTQTDGSPEYYTDIYVLCDCGKEVLFQLPVN